MTIELKIDGKVHEGWKAARVTRGIERVAGDFDLTVTEKNPFSRAVPEIRPGRLCELFAYGARVVTGYIDEVNGAYSDSSRTIVFRGRSKTADLVDCSAINEPGEWNDVTLAKIAADIAGKYGVSVSAGDVGAPFGSFRLQPGEKAFDAIERACRIRAVLATDNPEGGLVLTRTGSTRSSTKIHCRPSDTEMNNVLSAEVTNSHRDRYSRYVVKSQSVGGDDLFGDDAATPIGQATDSAITRTRTLILQAETQSNTAATRDRAAWESSVRRGKSLRASYTLQGWKQADGSLWTPNIIVPVIDDLHGIKGDLLVSEVTLSLDASGHKATLSVVPPEAYELFPEEESSGGGSSDPLAKYLEE